MTADEVYEKVYAWANEFDPDFAGVLAADPEYAKKILAIGRGGKKPRKDFAVWADVKPYMGFFYDEYFAPEAEAMAELYKFDKADIRPALSSFKASYDPADDMNGWFEKIKAIADGLGYASDMKAYKAAPESFKGSVADISMFLRVAVTGKLNAPDLYTAMQIIGKDRTLDRIEKMLSAID